MSLLAALLALPIRGYRRVISPLLGQRCRYYPSCSAYALEALERHGPLRGLALAVWRLLRCNPFSPGGVDHVPGHEAAPTVDADLTPGAVAC